MRKNFLFLLAMAVFLITCSDSDKFNVNSKSEIEIDIFYNVYNRHRHEPYIYAYANILPIGDEEYYYYYWVIDGERFFSQELEKKISYGEHFLGFVLIDNFGDTLSEGGYIRVDEPLKIALLSPVENYEAAKNDTIKFQYRISGVDKWEEDPQIIVYISKDEEVWENGKPIQDIFLMPPLNEQVYYWGIKAFNEQDTTFSEIRSLWIKN